MLITVQKQLLKDGISFLQQNNRISSDLKSDMDTFIDNLSDTYIHKLDYLDFNSTLSTNLTFTPATRTINFTADGCTIGSLISQKISLQDIRLKGIKIKATDENINYFFGYNTTEFYSIDSYDIDEIIEDEFYIKVTMQENSNVVRGLMLIYENN